jgi:hypothetical protein
LSAKSSTASYSSPPTIRRAKKIPKKRLKLLKNNNAFVIGGVLANIDMRKRRGYYRYGYGYGYYGSAEKDKE